MNQSDRPKFFTRRRFLKTLGLGGLTSVALGGYAFAVEPLYRLKVTTHAVSPPNWPRDMRLRVALITDIHACNPWMSAERIENIVQRTNALKPDVTLLLGDFSAGMSRRFVTSYVHSEEWAPILAGLQAPLGRYAVLGNHDWWEDKSAQERGDGPTFGQLALEKVGIPVFENDAIRLEHNGKPFWIAGLGDQIALLPYKRYGRHAWQGRDDLEGTLAKITDDAPVILMAHEPDIFPNIKAADRHIALTVSGHTHGGQFRVFGYSPVVPSRYDNRYAYGHVVEPDGNGKPTHLVVSGGLGCSIAPVRFGVPPEIVMVELSAAA